MSAVSWFRRIYLCYFSKPAGDRALLKACRKAAPKSIVEIGVGSGQRLLRLMEFVLESHAAADVRYWGVDLFEARPAESPGLALKQAHALFKPLGIKIQLVPGDPYSALARIANAVRDVDWFVIGADVDQDALHRAWPFVPRMLSDSTRLFWETRGADGQPAQFRELKRADVEAIVAEQKTAARRAA